MVKSVQSGRPLSVDRAAELRAAAERAAYVHVAKPLLFARDPEQVHDATTDLSEWVGRHAATRGLMRALFYYSNPALRQHLLGATFANPVGLAAGFDKNARLTQFLPAIGFGFEEVGSISIRPFGGNPKPRLHRLPNSKSIVVNYGLANEGAPAIAGRLAKLKQTIPVGISIVPTNDGKSGSISELIEEVAQAHALLAPLASYITLNLSCPNACLSQPFMIPANLRQLLPAITALPHQKPILLKLSPDAKPAILDEILAAASEYEVAGLISGNLTKHREGNPDVKDHLPGPGGLSGGAQSAAGERTLEHLGRQNVSLPTDRRFVLVGCGGIFSAADAYRQIGLGASLLQLITGMLFEGPQLPGEINRGLVELLHRDGFNHISQAVGKDL
jgi:dihydroorotate dehydrogenase subfamily 2